MLVIYKSRWLTRGEAWFNHDPARATPPVDWVLYHQQSEPVPGTKARPFYNRLIDLRKSQRQLESELGEETAYKIRRAQDRDGIICESCDPLDTRVMNRFEQMYNEFAKSKSLEPLDRRRLESFAQAGVLDMSVAKHPQGNDLVFHANYRDTCRATQLELPSLYRTLASSSARNFSGRASRLLTWTNILRYQAEGLESFDFGGWHPGNDPALLQINEFKRGFGGQVVREYQCERIVTLKAWVVLSAARLLGQARTFSFGRGDTEPNAEPELPEVQISLPAK